MTSTARIDADWNGAVAKINAAHPQPQAGEDGDERAPQAPASTGRIDALWCAAIDKVNAPR